MMNFLLGLFVAGALAIGAYFFWLQNDPEVQQLRATGEAASAQVKTQVKTNPIPAGVMMEDGTLPE